MKRIIGLTLLLALLFSAMFILNRVSRTAIPRTQLICTLNRTWQTISIEIPEGHHFNLLIGMPPDATNSSSGRLTLISNQEKLAEINFTTESATAANWLEAHQLKAYLITLPRDAEPIRLDDKMKRGEQLTLEVQTSETNTAASLWLSYLGR